jgi:hypothetical protein
MGPYPFDRSTLLNARLGRRFSIPAHLSVEGFLLAEGSAVVPTQYRHGAAVGVEVTVFASKGRKYSIWIALHVERQDQVRTPTNGLPRRRLLEPDEHDDLMNVMNV